MRCFERVDVALSLQVRIVKHAFEIINLLTDQNPIQVVVDAIINRSVRSNRTTLCRMWFGCTHIPYPTLGSGAPASLASKNHGEMWCCWWLRWEMYATLDDDDAGATISTISVQRVVHQHSPRFRAHFSGIPHQFFACSGPREDATRIGSAGVVRRQAVDISPLRRVNQAIWLLTTGAREAAFRNIKTVAECLADELVNAAKGSSNR